MMRYLLLLLLVGLTVQAQGPEQFLGKKMSAEEALKMEDYLKNMEASGIVDPPQSPVRTPAEWEEAKALVIAWTAFPAILRQIVQHAKEEVEVIIVADNPTGVVNYLNNYNIDTVNVSFINAPYNSIWIRDYGQWSVYTNEVDSLLLVDWIYNRPRPADDQIPTHVAEYYDLPLYQTIDPPYDLMHTGGNFMTDGLGTGFSSNLVLDENDGAGPSNINYPIHTEEEINDIMQQFMGINRFIKMENLPYDAIHHIDMHMKLLDEETILISEYPEGIADGPQIEENIAYIQENFLSSFGTPYDIVRIPAPPDLLGDYPNTGGDYRTFTNSIIINKTILVPVYGSSYEEGALELYQSLMPGYNVVGINCNQMIPSFGALHCITKLVHTDDPMWIVHQKLRDVNDSTNLEGYPTDALIRHRSDIAEATLHYRTHEDSAYVAIDMTSDNAQNWSTLIPVQLDSTNVQYYIEATSNSGKTQRRPMTAPEGYWAFNVYNGITDFNDTITMPIDTMMMDTMDVDTMPMDTTMMDTTGVDTMNVGLFELNVEGKGIVQNIYPNPASTRVVLDVYTLFASDATLQILNTEGKVMIQEDLGKLPEGENQFVLEVDELTKGIYLLQLQTEFGKEVYKILIDN